MTTSIFNDNMRMPLDIYSKSKYHNFYIMGIFMMDKRDVSEAEERLKELTNVKLT